jgi:hypothetical protein
MIRRPGAHRHTDDVGTASADVPRPPFCQAGIRGPLVALALAATSAQAGESAPAIQQEADSLLRVMSEYLALLPAARVDIDTDVEVVDLAGQKLQYSASMQLQMQRPDKLRVERRGPFAESRMLFDGERLRISLVEPAAFAEIPAAGNIETAVRALRYEAGLDAPAGDFLFDDPYIGLMTDVISGADLGTAFIDDIECHHLAFRAKQVDWQIWIQTGDEPLPLKYVITSKWITGAPQFTARFRDWDLPPAFDANAFSATLPADAVRLDRIPVNAVGALAPQPEQ